MNFNRFLILKGEVALSFLLFVTVLGDFFDFFHIEFWHSFVGVEAVYLLLYVVKLGIAEATDVW